MKEPRQFLPLLAQMLGFYRSGPLVLLLWLLPYCVVLYFVGNETPTEWMEGHNSSLTFQNVQIAYAGALWLFMMLVSTPLPMLVLGGATSLEFVFTRGVDRAVWLRAERVALLVVAVAPLVANFAYSPWAPKLAFSVASPSTSAAEVQARYRNLFPGSDLQQLEPGQDKLLVVNQGTEWFAGWLVWVALVLITLVAGYFSWAFRAWQRGGWHHSKSNWRPWLGSLMVFAPAFSVVAFYFASIILQINPYEETFLFFAQYPLPLVAVLVVMIWLIQPYTERNLRKLEFEFY